jgi:endonuclease/exonuclease/phosphatase family metal-dependent hydrolase
VTPLLLTPPVRRSGGRWRLTPPHPLLQAARLWGLLCLWLLAGACPESGAETPLRLPGVPLPATTVGAPYQVGLAPGGAVPPVRYQVERLPPGFSFYLDTGALWGPASEAGDFSFSVTVEDGLGRTDRRDYGLRVHPAPAVTSTQLPPAIAGRSYVLALQAQGGQAPLSWSVASGALPPGVALLPQGMLSGTPSQAGRYSFIARVQDASRAEAEQLLLLEVRASSGGTGGGAGQLMVGNWNIPWFGHTGFGPTNETLQLNNAAQVLGTVGADFWALQEVVDPAHFARLVEQLPGFEGILASDSTRVPDGALSYSPDEQKLAVLYRSSVVQVERAELILREHNYDFAGRPPLRVDLRLTLPDTEVQHLVAIVLHMKAQLEGTDVEAYSRRQRAGQALKGYLDTELPDAQVLVLGDWNDDVDVSIARDADAGTFRPTPYQPFLDDAQAYTFLTLPMSLAGAGTTVGRTNVIDHQMVSNELVPHHVSGSTLVLRPDLWSPPVSAYSSTTSDHYPVVSRFSFGHAPARTLKLLSPNGGELLAQGSAADIRWEASGVEQVRLEVALAGGSFTSLATGVSARSGSWTWTVPKAFSASTVVRVSDVQEVAVFDTSDAPFCLVPPERSVFVNELLPHPLNREGSTQPDYEQQYVELYNPTSSAVDVSGWRLDDDKSFSGLEPTRHTFAEGTVLQPGQAFVVYSGASAVPAGATWATWASGNDGLRLNRGRNHGSSGDTVYLRDAEGVLVDTAPYADTYPGVSYNRSPDAAWACQPLVRHDSLAPGLAASPGARADGGAF